VKRFLCLLASIGAVLWIGWCMPPAAIAQEKAPNAGAAGLMLILRQAPGANKPDDVLAPAAIVSPADAGWFNYLGDMQLRFVFDAGTGWRDASPQDLRALGLTQDQAVSLAVQNIKRLYGEPEIQRGNGGLMLIQARSADFSGSYLLDTALWQGLLAQAPGGLVVAAPKRGGLLFAPLADTKSVERLRKLIAPLHAGSGSGKLSSALYLFKDNRWTVFQAPSQE